MNDIIPTLDATRFAALIDSLKLTDNVRDYHALSGLMLALASSPVPLDPDEWFHLIFLDPEQSDAAAEPLLVELLALRQHWAASLEGEDARLSFPDEYQVQDGAPSAALASFASGVMLGYGWLQEDWSELIESLPHRDDIADVESIFGTTLAATLCLADEEAARELLMAAEVGETLSANEALDMAREGLFALGNLGLMAVSLDKSNAHQEPYINPLRHVGRNEPCPCGSGKKYKQCCLR